MTALHIALALYEIAGIVSLIRFLVNCQHSGEFDVFGFNLWQWTALVFICLLTGPWLMFPERQVRP